MYYVRVKDDIARRRWKVREAVSLRAAFDCIVWAMVTGSVGGKDVVTDAQPGKPVGEWPQRVIADVVQVNSDYTERRAYEKAY